MFICLSLGAELQVHPPDVPDLEQGWLRGRSEVSGVRASPHPAPLPRAPPPLPPAAAGPGERGECQRRRRYAGKGEEEREKEEWQRKERMELGGGGGICLRLVCVLVLLAGCVFFGVRYFVLEEGRGVAGARALRETCFEGLLLYRSFYPRWGSDQTV